MVIMSGRGEDDPDIAWHGQVTGSGNGGMISWRNNKGKLLYFLKNVTFSPTAVKEENQMRRKERPTVDNLITFGFQECGRRQA